MMKFNYMWIIIIYYLLMILFILHNKNIHPIYMIITIIIYCLLIMPIMSSMTMNFIYSILFFLIMISGLLIIFLYFTSLISNEKYALKFNLLLIILLLLNLIFLMMNTNLNYLNFLKPNLKWFNLTETTFLLINSPMFNNIYKIYSYPFNNLTLLCMVFLLFALFMIIKICSLKSIPLRKLKK